MAVTKFSRQRETIREYLMSTKSHPTADMVYEYVRSIYPNISLGTVYRNLNLLAEQGIIVKLAGGEGSDRFDGNTEPHYHFRCRKCGCVSDLNISSLEHINTLAAVDFDGIIEGHVVMFYGVCRECRE